MNGIAKRFIAAVATFLWIGGCASIVGIEDHTFDAAPVHSPACIAYCDTVALGCKGSNALYSTRDACLGTCDKLPPGDDLEPGNTNTVACRKKEAQRAVDTSEPQAHCPSAGPGGAPGCGNNCDSWCKLLEQVCPTQYGAMPNCPRACAALKDRGAFNLDIDHDGDTVQCRIEHVSNATGSAAAPATHCGHAALVPTEYCRAVQDNPPDCAEYCRFNMAACTGDLAVWESPQQCMAVCMSLDLGLNKHREENSMGCRSWHTFNSLIDPASHCAHTGPGGDGHCGLDAVGKTGNCVSYCALLEKACPAGFTTKYVVQSACQLDCSTQLEGARADSKYRLSMATSGNTLQCRTLYASRALTDDTACPSALGQGACQ